MSKFYDITGARYGRLTVVGITGQKKYDKHLWACLCDCGNTTHLIKRVLESGNTRSCGCLLTTTHGASETAMYRTWAGILTRCLNPKAPAYRNYGARGITVCDRWRGRSGFANFLADMGPKPEPGYSLDRADNSGPYSPDNCRWATHEQQSNNRRANVLITIQGETKTLMQWTRAKKLPYDRVWHRLRAGWAPERALEVTS